MARVQLVMSDEDHDLYVCQARREGLSLNAWLRAAARERLDKRQAIKQFESPEEVQEFFVSCAAREGAGTEPDWNDHLRVMHESRGRGTAET